MKKFPLYCLMIMLILLIMLNLITGSRNISIYEILELLFNRHINETDAQILLYSRLPRVIGSILIGSALAGAGLALQVVTQNPLADAGLLGVNASASVGVALILAFYPTISFGPIVIISCCFSAVSLLLIFYLSRRNKLTSMNTNIILLGMIISLFMTACATTISIYFNINKSVMYWSVGGLTGIRWEMIYIIFPLIIIGIILLFIISKPLSILAIGNDYASSLGINITLLYSLIFIVVFLLTGASVAVAGSLSFVGIIAPHFVRVFFSGNIQQMIPLTFILGSILVVLSDIISRTIVAPFIAPIGSIIAFIGVPIFIYIAERRVMI